MKINQDRIIAALAACFWLFVIAETVARYLK